MFRLAGQVLHGQRMVQPFRHPREQLGEGVVVLGGYRGGDELGLAAGPVRRHDQAAGDRVGDHRAVVAADQMQAQIRRGGLARVHALSPHISGDRSPRAWRDRGVSDRR